MNKLFFLSLLFPAFAFSQPMKGRIYPFESAIINYKYEASFGGIHTKYIDEYGYKQADYIRRELNVNGNIEKEYETIILIGNKAYTINWSDSTVAVGPNSTYSYYQNHKRKTGVEISDALLQKAYGYQLAGTETYLKKECKSWKAKGGKQLTWNGVMLSSEVNMFMMMVEKATSIKVNKKVPKDAFDIPQGLTYISADVYQGFSGLEPLFMEIDSVENADSEIKVSFSTSSLAPSNEFTYPNTNGEPILLKGDNDFNKIDHLIIKSQAYAMQTVGVELPKYSTLIFKSNEGLYGKMQLNEIGKGRFSVRYMLFDKIGFVVEYSEQGNNVLRNDFDFIINNSKLKIAPKNKAKCLVLGW